MVRGMLSPHVDHPVEPCAVCVTACAQAIEESPVKNHQANREDAQLPSLRRDLLLTTGGVVTLALLAIAVGLFYVKPAPPTRIVIAVASEGQA